MTQTQKIFCHLPALLKVIYRYGTKSLCLFFICTDCTEDTGDSQLFDFFFRMGEISSQKDHSPGLLLLCHIQSHIQFIILFFNILKNAAVSFFLTFPLQSAYQFSKKSISQAFYQYRDCSGVGTFQIPGAVIRNVVGFCDHSQDHILGFWIYIRMIVHGPGYSAYSHSAFSCNVFDRHSRHQKSRLCKSLGLQSAVKFCHIIHFSCNFMGDLAL